MVRILVENGIAPYKSYDICYVPLTTAPILYCIVVTIMYCIIFHTMLYIPVLLLLNKLSINTASPISQDTPAVQQKKAI